MRSVATNTRNEDSTNMIKGNHIILRDKSINDVQDDYKWETDPELATLDATVPVKLPFNRYKVDYAEEIRNPYFASCRFGIDTLDGKHIGNCAYYHISERAGETELGIMIGERKYWNQGYGVDVVSTLINHIFEHTALKRVYLKTLATNYRAQTCFRKAGFKPYVRLVRDGYDFLFMEIYRREWLLRNKDNNATGKSKAEKSNPDTMTGGRS
jgi:[ribosomal protein S5]-alanine N-acetyltransferase